MNIKRQVPIYILLLSFLLGEIIHIGFWGVPFTYCLVQLFYGAMVILWMVSIHVRILEKKIRIPLFSIASMLLFSKGKSKVAGNWLRSGSEHHCKRKW